MADTSIKTANNNIIDLLTSAGADGLHCDDILYLLGFQEKNVLINRLKDLKVRGEISDLPGDRWKKLDKAPDEASALLEVLKEEESLRPIINLPGGGKFCSYKNSLQEYAQKKSQPVPTYRTVKEGAEFFTSVTLSLQQLKSQVGYSNAKDSEARVAFDALQKLGYLEGDQYIAISEAKRKAVNGGKSNGVPDEKKTKVMLCDSTVAHQDLVGKSPKSRLQEHCQKMKMDIPQYTTQSVEGVFFQTNVLVGGIEYSGTPKPKKKEAAAAAAEVALRSLKLMM